MPKLILHAGIHKTGTTAIQAFAHKNRAALAKSSILYPYGRSNKRWEQPAQAHHEFAHAIADKDKYLKWHQVETYIRSWAKEASEQGLDVLISSEAIYRHVLSSVQGPWIEKRKGYLKRLSTALSGFDVSVVLVLRRQDDYIKSLFQEAVMKNSPAGRKTFTDFRKQYLTDHKKTNFNENLCLFELFFSKVNVLIYEDLIHSPGLCANFFDYLGLDNKDMSEVGIVRQSLKTEQTVLKNFLNPCISSSKQNYKILNWIRSKPVQNLLNKYYTLEAYDLWENYQARKDFLATFEEDNEKIRARYFPDRPALFPPIIDAQPPMVPKLTEKFKAELALMQLSDNPLFLNKMPSILKKVLTWIR